MGIMSFMLNNTLVIVILLIFGLYFLYFGPLKYFAKDDKEKNIESLVKILMDIIDNGVHLSILETDDAEPHGKHISNQVTETTNIFFVFLFLSMFAPLLVEQKSHVLTPLIIVFSSVILVYLVRFVCSLLIRKEDKIADYLEKQIKQNSLSTPEYLQDLKFKVFIRSIYITPFTLRHIWWFVLMFGFINVQLETLERAKIGTICMLRPDFPSDASSYFLKSFINSVHCNHPCF